jgi:hypothetical protein
MKELKDRIERFSFGQLTSNSDGKTSGSGTAGLYIVLIGGICFLMGCIDKMFLNDSVDIITQSIVFAPIGAALLGYRKSKDNGINHIEENGDVGGDSEDSQLNS